jgi:glyoxylase-like metal-dependent hydrolase (beta-lactamase superfamily II)
MRTIPRRTVLTAVAAFAASPAAPAKAADAWDPGFIRFRWNAGSLCAANNRDPRIQIVAYNAHTLILRQNVAVHWEAPFTYLLAGREQALLIDTGATPEAAYYPLRKTVDALLQRQAWLRGKAALPLNAILTSAEDIAQNQGKAQFEGRPDTRWVTQPGELDLGDRRVTVLSTPGTHKDGLSVYDHRTGLLFTGDLLMPGRLLISNDRDYIASLERLEQFAGSHPVRWILGGHIEMSSTPGIQYPMRTTYKPNEHLLQLEPAAIREALTHARRIEGKSVAAIRAEFILLNRVGPDERGDWPADLPALPPAAYALR